MGNGLIPSDEVGAVFLAIIKANAAKYGIDENELAAAIGDEMLTMTFNGYDDATNA